MGTYMNMALENWIPNPRMCDVLVCTPFFTPTLSNIYKN